MRARLFGALRPALIVFLAAGAVFGFGAGFAHLRHSHCHSECAWAGPHARAERAEIEDLTADPGIGPACARRASVEGNGGPIPTVR